MNVSLIRNLRDQKLLMLEDKCNWCGVFVRLTGLDEWQAQYELKGILECRCSESARCVPCIHSILIARIFICGFQKGALGLFRLPVSGHPTVGTNGLRHDHVSHHRVTVDTRCLAS